MGIRDPKVGNALILVSFGNGIGHVGATSPPRNDSLRMYIVLNMIAIYFHIFRSLFFVSLLIFSFIYDTLIVEYKQNGGVSVERA